MSLEVQNYVVQDIEEQVFIRIAAIDNKRVRDPVDSRLESLRPFRAASSSSREKGACTAEIGG